MIDKNEAPEGFEAVSDQWLELGTGICDRCDYCDECGFGLYMPCTDEERKDGENVIFKAKARNNETKGE